MSKWLCPPGFMAQDRLPGRESELDRELEAALRNHAAAAAPAAGAVA